MNLRSIGVIGGLSVILAVAGCRSSSSSSPYVAGYRFQPQPAMVAILTREQKTAVNVLVSVIGIRQAEQNNPASAEVRIRLENKGDVPAVFDPLSMSMVSGSLQPFGPPQVNPPQPVQIAPGQSMTLTALFPLPPGLDVKTMELNFLRLEWEVQIDKIPIQQTAGFERVSPLYSGSR